MEIYLVGGAVRDKLLGLQPKELDWVVVGSSPEEMLAKGFKPVGKDFPVFLHPKTHEEYALARTERKTAKGYHGFSFHAAPDVTLEEDLKRRDLTINAIAEDEAGNLIDPYNGKTDIANKVFRHVSSAFAEDPVRLLRVCRFSSKLPGFTIAPETLRLMRDMVASGEIDALVPERVWKELEIALGEKDPGLFFKVSDKSNAFDSIFEEISDKSILDALPAAAALSQEPVIRFAASFGQMKPGSLKALCERMRIPNRYSQLAALVARHSASFKLLETNDAECMLDILEKADAFRRPERFDQFALACRAITQESLGSQKALAYEETLKTALESCQKIKVKTLTEDLRGLEIAKAIRGKRLEAIRKLHD